MNNNWKNLGNKVKTELDNQQAPIPDFKEFVEYRRLIESDSKPSSSTPNLGIGPWVKFTIAIVSIIAAGAVIYPMLQNEVANSVISNNTIQHENEISPNIHNNTILLADFETPETTTSNLLNHKKTQENEQVIINKRDVENDNHLNKPSNFTTNNLASRNLNKTESTDLFSNQLTNSGTKNQTVVKNNINNTSASNGKKRVFVTFGNSTFEVDPSIFENAKNHGNTTFDKNGTAFSDNQSEITLSDTQNESKINSNKEIMDYSLLPTLEVQLLDENWKGFEKEKIPVSAIKKPKRKVNLNFSILGGISTENLMMRNIGPVGGLMLFRQISKRHGIDLRTGLRYHQINSRIEINDEQSYTDANGNVVNSVHSSTSSNFHFLEIPIECIWNIKGIKRLGIFGGSTFYGLVGGSGNSTTAFFNNGSYAGTANSNGGYANGFRKFNVGATIGMEYKLTHRISIGSFYYRAILKAYQAKVQPASEFLDKSIVGDIYFQNARLYVSYKIR